jgi:hypothetical protein
VLVDNQTSSEVSFGVQIGDAAVTTGFGPLSPGAKGPVLGQLGLPPSDDPIFRGGMCTTVGLIAYDAEGREIARHPPGLCFGDTWVIGDDD